MRIIPFVLMAALALGPASSFAKKAVQSGHKNTDQKMLSKVFSKQCLKMLDPKNSKHTPNYEDVCACAGDVMVRLRTEYELERIWPKPDEDPEKKAVFADFEYAVHACVISNSGFSSEFAATNYINRNLDLQCLQRARREAAEGNFEANGEDVCFCVKNQFKIKNGNGPFLPALLDPGSPKNRDYLDATAQLYPQCAESVAKKKAPERQNP